MTEDSADGAAEQDRGHEAEAPTAIGCGSSARHPSREDGHHVREGAQADGA